MWFTMRFFRTKKEQTILFDEVYCHSAGNGEAKTYDLERGITDLTFDFGSLEHFVKVYVRENAHFPEDAIEALQQDQAIFTVQVVQDTCTYMLKEPGLTEQLLLSKDTLVAMGPGNFKLFTDGVIGVGIYHLGQFRFQVLWATMYASC